ncbi:MAG: hypothetical protein D6743_04605 [Calditrichaeota bacterium]|nr:MAG: hypothetical protein D6743_04605 [Calditrichota bacterium]
MNFISLRTFRVLRIRIRPCICTVLWCAGISLNACKHAPVEPPSGVILATVEEVNVAEGPHSVLSVVVTATVRNAVQVAVEYGNESRLKQRTPAMVVSGGVARVPVLGLHANTNYELRAVAISPSGHETRGGVLHFTTSALPDDLPTFSILTTDAPTPGFVMLGFATAGGAATHYALLVDNRGEVVWYRGFPRPIMDFQKQENSQFIAYTSLDVASPSHFYQFDRLGEITGEFHATDGFTTGPHEFGLVAGGYFLFAIEHRPMDLTAVGGRPDADVRGTGIEYHRPNGEVFRWSPFEHLRVTDAVADIALDGEFVNPWHGNALTLDRDGHFLVSFRNMDQVVKVNSRTGAVIWRLGGERSDFTFVDDPLGGFSHQHGVRRLPNGNIILFDNGNLHSPPFSRAAEYQLDEKNKIATLVWEFRHAPPLFSFALGFAQRLANGRTLINYGTAQRVVEVDAAGKTRWEMTIQPADAYPYRAFRLDSLY